MSAYNLSVPNGTYTVHLHFAETYWTSANERLFSATVEGAPIVGSGGTTLDLFTEAGGANRAWVPSLPVTVTDGTITITFSATKDNATIKAIEVRQQASETPTGDVNGDEQVNGEDLLLVVTKYGQLTISTGEDINSDGKVNLLDAVAVLKNWTL